MLTSLLLVGLGLALLVAGGEFLVRAASSIARLLGVSPSVIGLTVVAAGTSMPELVVSARASLAGNPGLAVGNVVGSNIFNIGAILGIAALLAPLRIVGKTVRLEWPGMLLAASQLYLLARDGHVDRVEGGFFLLALVVFVAYAVKIARSDVSAPEAEQFAASVPQLRTPSGRAWPLGIAGVAGGCALLAVGAQALVVGAIDLARAAGMSETVISLTIVAAGTSLPELAASAVASLRGRDDVAVTNVIGSNIFNVLGIVGVSAVLHPLAVPEPVLHRDVLWMLAFSLLLLPLLRTGFRVNRLEGALLLGGYGAYLLVLLAG